MREETDEEDCVRVGVEDKNVSLEAGLTQEHVVSIILSIILNDNTVFVSVIIGDTRKRHTARLLQQA